MKSGPSITLSATHRLVLVVVVFGIEWCLFGYRYFVSGAGLELVPIINRYLNPSYLPADYYLNGIMAGGNHRLLLTVLAGELARIVGSVERSMLSLFVVFGLISNWALCRILERWCVSYWSVLLCMIAAALFWYLVIPYNLPGNVTPIHAELSANHVARAFLYWAILLSLVGSILGPITLVCLAAAFQPIDGILTYPLVVFISLIGRIRESNEPNRVLPLIGMYLAGAAIIVTVVVLINRSLVIQHWDPDVFQTLLSVRFPHHYLPETWSHSSWAWLSGVAITGSWMLYRLGEKPLLYAGLGVLFLFLCYLLILTVAPSVFIYKLQGAKLLWGNYVIWGLAMSAGLYKECQRWASIFNRGSRIFRTTIVLAGSLILGTVLYAASNHGLENLKSKALRSAKLLSEGNYRSSKDYYVTGHQEIARWLKYNSDESDLILHPPEINAVRSVSERASVLLNTLAGFSPSLGKEYLLRRESLQDFCLKTDSDLALLANTYQANVIIVPTRDRCAIQQRDADVWQNHFAGWLISRVE